jgi:hypothetical protein
VLKKKKARLVYLDCAVNETISVIAKRFEEKGRSKEFTSALQKIEQAIPTESISWMYPEVRRLYPDILAVIKEHKGQLNFHDALMVLAAKAEYRGKVQYMDGWDYSGRSKKKDPLIEIFMMEERKE